MEYMEGGNLLNYLQNQKQKNLFYILVECLKSILILHENDVIHRDIAARNYLITYRSEDMLIKLSDFGLAKSMKEEKTHSTIKLDSSRDFCLRWLSPESIKSKSFGTHSDIWSFGVTAFEIFSLGKYPYFDIKDDDKIKMQVANYQLCPIKPKGADSKIWSTISKCFLEIKNRINCIDLYKQLNDLK